MAPTKTSKTSSATTKTKKEKVFHPQSRKADQLARKSIRKDKLAGQSSDRKTKNSILADFYGFFYHSLPPEGALSLDDLHNLIANVWLKRFDEELEAERASRRKGRPKSTKEQKLEELKLRESELYRTGFEVIDLTHPPTVALFRTWDQKEVAFIDLLRFIKINSTNPQSAVVIKPGKHVTIIEDTSNNDRGKDAEMCIDSGVSTPSILAEPPERFASTIMTMDEPIS
ncbi:translation machinery-associated protein 16 [Stygiomarasmius scandens]|uniref:Translation machinery-associated protein 16 n=1 Tax=Marasmiellus scandens TaxID=2682957 RepID=A0ABR1JWW5_9AGAR